MATSRLNRDLPQTPLLFPRDCGTAEVTVKLCVLQFPNHLQSSSTISNLGDFNRADANGHSPKVTSHETQLPGKGKEQPLGEGGKEVLGKAINSAIYVLSSCSYESTPLGKNPFGTLNYPTKNIPHVIFPAMCLSTLLVSF